MIPKNDNAVAKNTARSRKSGCGLVNFIAVTVFVGILLSLLLPSVSNRRPQRRSICDSRLRRIVGALHIYHDRNGAFPPAYTIDSRGNPLHSWRTLILPYLDQKALYERVKIDEPWDSPHNIQMAKQHLPIFACPTAKRGISFLAVTIAGGVFDKSAPVTMKDITDGLSNTIVVVEVTDGPSSWMQPVDFDDRALDQFLANGLKSNHSGGLNVAFADGSVRFVQSSVSPRNFRARLTRNGGDDLADEAL